jgi:hypothetical protein
MAYSCTSYCCSSNLGFAFTFIVTDNLGKYLDLQLYICTSGQGINDGLICTCSLHEMHKRNVQLHCPFVQPYMIAPKLLLPTAPPPPPPWGISFPGIKQPGREADHSLSSSAEVKKCMELYLHPCVRLHGVMFGQAQG